MSFFFFFNDTATTEIYTLSLHDALPILRIPGMRPAVKDATPDPLEPEEKYRLVIEAGPMKAEHDFARSEEHTSELQSPDHLVCRLLLEKKKKVQHVRKLSLPPTTAPHTD